MVRVRFKGHLRKTRGIIKDPENHVESCVESKAVVLLVFLLVKRLFFLAIDDSVRILLGCFFFLAV